jgi:hypothetical protein
MALNRKTLAWLVVVLGLLLIAAGAALVYLPAGLVVAGMRVRSRSA